MKRPLAMVLAALLACSLAACGGKTEAPTEVPNEVEKAAVTHLKLYKAGNSLVDWELYQEEWDKLYLSEADAEKYPALAEVLKEMNIERDVYQYDLEQQMKEDARTARDEMGESFHPFYSNAFYYVQRADDRMVSIREDWSEYSGGMHGMYGTFGHVFDTETGERLALADVITDTDAIPGILAEKLVEKYPGDIIDTVADLTETLAGYAVEDFIWTVDYQGVTFYFDPYERASYAAGRLTATIWFEEHPELFDEKYTELPENGYIKEIPLWDDIELDLVSGDGKTDSMYVIAESIGEYDEKCIRVRKNDVGYTDPESYGYDFTPHLVYRDGGFYVLVESVAENDYRTIYLYDLNGAEITACDINHGTGFHRPDLEMEEEQYGLREVLNDPSAFRLDTRVQMLSTMDGTNTYECVSGILLQANPYYTLPEDFPPLVSRIAMDAYLYEEDVTEEIPAGTAFYFLRTDNDSYVDMRLDDGRECRLEVGFGEWGRTVNGIPEYDAFDGVLYAG